MTGDDALALRVYIQEFAHPLRHIAVTGAVEAVASHPELFVQAIWNGVHISLGRHSLVESRIKHTHLRQLGHQFTHGTHALEVGRVVQRCQVDARLKRLEHLLIQHHALVELLATMHHAVSHGINLVQALEHTHHRVGEQREDELHALGMLRYVVHYLFFISSRQFHLDKRACHTYAFGTTRGEHRAAVHVVQCILDRRRTAV